MAVQNLPPRPQGAAPDSVPMMGWLDALRNRVVGSSGLFTPTVVSSGGGAPTYSVQYGSYTKIGDRVIFNLRVVLATLGTLAAGNVTIEGLPEASDSTAGNVTALSIITNALAAGATTSIQAANINGTSVVTPSTYAAGATTQLTVALLTGTSAFNVSGAYKT